MITVVIASHMIVFTRISTNPHLILTLILMIITMILILMIISMIIIIIMIMIIMERIIIKLIMPTMIQMTHTFYSQSSLYSVCLPRGRSTCPGPSWAVSEC